MTSISRQSLIEKTADRFENALSRAIKSSPIEAPILQDFTAADHHKWYRFHLEEGLSGDGSEYHVYIKKGADIINGPLCLFFSGGGIAYDTKTASSPATAGRIITGDGGYYWSNLRPFTQLMNIGAGITDLNRRKNPFYNWKFVVITYSTGDFHVGDADYEYTDSEGLPQPLHFHGYRNFTAAMEKAKDFFPYPGRLLIAGDSAGGFAVLALASQICKGFYDKCRRITVFSDSAFLEKDDWSSTISDMWKAPDTVCSDIRGKSLSTEWYRQLYDDMGDRAGYLFACSPRDYLLSSFRNEIINGEYRTDPIIQREYRNACREMLRELKRINPKTGIFTYNWKNVIYPGGGTVHTAVRTPFFYIPAKKKQSLAKWLALNIS